MGTATINEDSLYDIGDALRETIDTTDTYLPSEMGPAIRASLGSNVRYTPQSPTDAQKQQARANIGAVSDSELTDVVRYTSQSKTTAQKTQARTNIGAQETLTFDNSPTSGSNNPVKSGGVYTALQGKQDTLTFDNTPTVNSNNPVKSGGVYTALQGKQNTLTFDNTPTSGSSNPVKSGGVYTALQGKQDTLTFDNTPTSGSSNPVKSSGIYTALQGKQNTLTFDNTPTANSSNPVKSGGIKTAIDGALASVATADAGNGVMLKQKNTIAAPVPEFTLYGKATQVHTEASPNLAKPTPRESNVNAGITFTYNAATNTITASGTGRSTAIYSENNFLTFDLPAGTYIFKDMLGNTDSNVSAYINYTDGTTTQAASFTSARQFTFNNRCTGYIEMRLNNPATFDNKSMQFMVVAGSTEPTEFVPYREASPSPTNPSPINMPGSSGSIGVMHAGKNLANLSSFYTNGTAEISSIDAATGAITVTGKGTNRYAGAFGPGLLYFVPNVTYTFSGRVLANDGGYAQAAVRNAAGQIRYSSTANQLGPFSLTFTPDSAGWYVTLFCTWDDASLTGGVTYGGIQIEAASSATAFEPYGGATVTLPTPNGLPGLPVSSGGNYIDKGGQRWVCDTIDKAAGTYTRRIGSVTWDGSNDEQWTYQGWSLPGFSIGVPGSVVQTNANLAPNVLCNRLVAIPNMSSFREYDSLLSMSNNAPTYQVAISGLNTEQKFRDFLGDHHEITMIYQLATPVVTQLSAAQIAALDALQSHDGTTILATTDAMQPEMAAAMCSDLAARIAALEDCIEVICYAHNDLVDGSGYHIDYVDGEVVTEVEPNG